MYLIWVDQFDIILQKSHRDIVQIRLHDIHAEIVSTMKQVYTVFKNDGPEVSICLLNTFQSG